MARPSDQTEIAQFNMARCRWPVADERMAGFTGELDRVNASADDSPGFVWRLQDESGNATAIRAYDDEGLIVNLSVWTSVEALSGFVLATLHRSFLRRRREWFVPIDGPSMVLWRVPAGERPTPLQGRERLERLAEHGPTADAFTFATAATAGRNPQPAG